MVTDANGNIIFVQRNSPLYSTTANVISRLDLGTGIISTIAGNGQFGFAGDGSAALHASFSNPLGLAIDVNGNLYIADALNQRIRKLDKVTGIISTIAGDGQNRLPTQNVPAINVSLNTPVGVSIDNNGNLLIADINRELVTRVNLKTGILTNIAGNGYYGTGPDCVSSTSELPAGDINSASVADAAGTIYGSMTS